MSRPNELLQPGDAIFHPKYGFGAVQGVTRRDPLDPTREPASPGGEPGRGESYYDIRLEKGGTLLVPVGRAAGVGLRRLTNGVEAIEAGLRSPAQGLPDGFRARTAALKVREQLAEPAGLTHAVRDVLAQSRGRTLSAGEKLWLDKSCQRLSTEAALVDHISIYEARAAIWAVVHDLSA